ncbi:MAG: TetR/AcrR family transcriptional regulator, partial [Leptolyngbya sp. SIO1D8]|nr:TetR/AcrR family transcriptional regulator [Leptolyngbya sp. SIO1D8]
SLIQAALALIAEKEDAKTLSLREVARRVGVSHTAPYRHFADKDALLAAVAEEGFHILKRYLQSGLEETSGDALRKLQGSGVAYVKFAISHPSHYRVMFGAFQPGNPDYPSLNAAGEKTFTTLMEAITNGQATGNIKVGDPQQLSWVAWALVHGLAMLLIERQLPLTDEQEIVALAEFATRSLNHGIQPEEDTAK